MTAGELLEALRTALGPDLDGWWPAEGAFEVAVGAILVQAVSWRNARLAVAALRERGLLAPEALELAPGEDVAQAVRPALFHQQKARYLQSFARFVARDLGGDLTRLQERSPGEQRRLLRQLPGVGEETAAAIMVYALGQAVAVADAYALRVLPRVGATGPGADLAETAARMADAIGGRAKDARDLHAGIVELGRTHCRPEPRCGTCPLHSRCPQILGHPAQRRSDRCAQNAGSAAAGREAGDTGRGRAASPQGGRGAGARALGEGAGGRLGQPQRARKRSRRRGPGA